MGDDEHRIDKVDVNLLKSRWSEKISEEEGSALTNMIRLKSPNKNGIPRYTATLSAIVATEISTIAPSNPNIGGKSVMKIHA